MSTTRKSYPSDVTDDEWEYLLPYLTLMREYAPQREYPLRDMYNALRYGEDWLPVALYAARIPGLNSRVSASASLAASTSI